MLPTKPKMPEDDLRVNLKGEEDTKKLRSGLWFSDGNVILEAEGKQFRVHQGVLAKHSTVFKDMFVNTNTDDGKTCPIIQIADKSEDVEHILNALYDW